MTSLSKYLPEEVVVDILSRLPVKSLVRFRCVCKSWHSLITDPSFIAMHLNRTTMYGNSYILHMPVSLCGQNLCTVLGIQGNTFVEHSKIEIPFETVSNSYYIVGSCNGLLCLTDSSHDYYGRTIYLWNPSLRDFKTLHHSCIAHNFIHRSYHVVLGFGFDYRSGDYKIIRVIYYLEENTKCFDKAPPQAEVYSLSSDSWRTIGSIVQRILEGKSEAFVNGAVHWMASNSEQGFYEMIVSFNIADEDFQEMMLPENYSDGTRVDFVLLATLKESLALLVYSHVEDHGWCDRCHVWVMKEYGVVESWTKQFTIVPQEIMGRSFGFTKNGKFLMDNDNDELVSWDPENLEFEVIEITEPSFSFNVVTFMESLVQLGIKNAVLEQTKSFDGVTYQGINILLREREEESFMRPQEICHKRRKIEE